MLRTTSDIQIGEFRYKGVHSVSVESDFEKLTDRAVIQFPRRVDWKGKKITDFIKRKQKVTVRLGYDDKNETVFVGYVRDIGVKFPVEIICEDSMYLLKTGEVTLYNKSIDLEGLLKEIIPSGIEYVVTGNRQLGEFRISQVTPAKVLDYLKEKYYVFSFFVGEVLHVGLRYVPEVKPVHKMRFDRNIIIENSDLSYRFREDVKIQIKAVIIGTDNKRQELREGDPDGEVRTLHYYNTPLSDVKELLKAEIDRLKYTGYRGNFETFGTPFIKHGDIVDFFDPNYPEREFNRAFVKAVDTTFGTDGYRQKITIEGKA